MGKKEKKPQKLFRVTFRGHDYLGAWDEWQAKVVARDLLTAVHSMLQFLDLPEEDLTGANVTLVAEETELPEGRILEPARRSRGFGQRGAWIEEPPERKAQEEPRKTPLL
jgi:hypothetical protein